MLRRWMLTGLGMMTIIQPRLSVAQFSRRYQIGFLNGGARPQDIANSLYGALARGMTKLGYVEGRDFEIEYRFAEGKYERFPDLARSLVEKKVDVIVLGAMAATRPTQLVTNTIPIVMANSIDPVGNRLVDSLAHPGGNTTGLSSAYEDVFPKLIQLVTFVIPCVKRVAFILNSQNPIHATSFSALKLTLANTSIELLSKVVTNFDDIEPAFDQLSQAGAEALIVPADGFFLSQRQRLAMLALSRRLPSIYTQREYALAGALMSYGENIEDFLFRSATFVDRILKGAKAGDIPVEQPTNFKLILNDRTAKILGIEFSTEIIKRADEIIE